MRWDCLAVFFPANPDSVPSPGPAAPGEAWGPRGLCACLGVELQLLFREGSAEVTLTPR